jgi:DNA ligase (NAD+)
MTELETLIQKHRDLYWNGNSEISDFEYDQLLKKLEQEQPDSELLTNIENNDNSDKTVYHSDKMLSLEKVYSLEELTKWIDKIKRNDDEEFSISPKFDGLSGRYYKQSKVLSTRGSGEFGENISDKIGLIKFDTDKKQLTRDYLDGEIVIDKLVFNKINENLEKKYKRPRNMVVGLINTKLENLNNQIQFLFVDYEKYETKLTRNKLVNEWEDIFNYYNYDNFMTDIDGIVIKVSDKSYYKQLGETAHHPRGAVAFKFDDRESESVLKNIVWQNGRTGKLTPVAEITPVIINGITVERVTLHNAKRVLDLDLHINDKVFVKRAGDVIPHITKVQAGENRKSIILENCPNCDGELLYSEPELYCNNEECFGNKLSIITAAVKSLEIEELGEPTLEKLLNLYDIDNVFDLFDLSLFQIKQISGFADKSSLTLFTNIQNVKNKLDDYKLLSALNIKNIGKTLSRELLSKHNLYDLMKLTYHDLLLIDHMGHERVISLSQGLKKYKELIDKLYSTCNVIELKNSQKVNPNSITLCFSGKFNYTKSYYYALAKQKGYNVTENLTKSVNILVSDETDTVKVKRALELNIPIATSKQFIEYVNSYS